MGLLANLTGDNASEEDPVLAVEEMDAFEAFFRARALVEIQHLVRLGFSPDCASEAVEETMATLCARWREIRYPRAWVRRTSQGHALTLTKQQFDVLPEDIESRNPAFRHYDEDPVIRQEAKARITQLLAGLPPKRRAVMSAWLDGLEDSEIAKDLKISEGTVRSHRRYGLADIARRLRLEGGLS